jgi:flagellar biosynthesis component FlhA
MITRGNVIYCGSLDEKLEDIILKLMIEYKSLNMSVNETLIKTVKLDDLIVYSKIIKAISNFVKYSKSKNYKPVIVCSKSVRIYLRKIIEKYGIIEKNFNNFNDVFVISYEEIPKEYIIQKIKIISIYKDDKNFWYYNNINN